MDRANLNSALSAVSDLSGDCIGLTRTGMKEDLGLLGNELNYAQTTYSVACIFAVLPVQMLLTRVHPRYLIPYV